MAASSECSAYSIGSTIPASPVRYSPRSRARRTGFRGPRSRPQPAPSGTQPPALRRIDPAGARNRRLLRLPDFARKFVNRAVELDGSRGPVPWLYFQDGTIPDRCAPSPAGRAEAGFRGTASPKTLQSGSSVHDRLDYDQSKLRFLSTTITPSITIHPGYSLKPTPKFAPRRGAGACISSPIAHRPPFRRLVFKS